MAIVKTSVDGLVINFLPAEGGAVFLTTDAGKLDAKTREFALVYGVKQILGDSAASAKTFTEKKTAMINKWQALLRGEVRAARGDVNYLAQVLAPIHKTEASTVLAALLKMAEEGRKTLQKKYAVEIAALKAAEAVDSADGEVAEDELLGLIGK